MRLTTEDLVALQLFRGESPAALEWLLEVVEVHELGRDEVLLSPDAPNSALYFILDGMVRVELNVEDRPVITHLGKGDSVGELSVLDEKPPTAYVIADLPTCVLSIEREYIWRLINTSHVVAAAQSLHHRAQ